MRPLSESATATPWKKPSEAALRAQCGVQTIYGAIARGDLRAARLMGGRGSIRIHEQWIDEWLTRSATPVEIRR